MEHETDSTEHETAQPYPEGLWGDVCHWFDAIVSVFGGDLKELASVGLTRSLAVKLCCWLWGVEGALRRLILAKALKLVPGLGETGTPPARSDGSRQPLARPIARQPCFRIFGFVGSAGQPTAATSSPDPTLPERTLPKRTLPKRTLPERWHIRFPSDPLLAIGERPKRKRASPSCRINPLARALACFDLNSGGRDDEGRDLFGLVRGLVRGLARGLVRQTGVSRSGRKPPLPLPDRPGYLRSDLSGWRKAEEEWARLIPAPHLSARICALARVMDNPLRAAARLARLFQTRRNLMASLLGQPAPELAWPRQARLVYRSREAEALLSRSWARLRHDTS